jgi:SHS2 domain-containing protein
MPYKYLEEIGTADIVFEATGRDLPQLFSDAADATINVMIENIEAIQPRETRRPWLYTRIRIFSLGFNFLPRESRTTRISPVSTESLFHEALK